MKRLERKWDHIHYAMEIEHKNNAGFDEITFVHQSLPDSSVDQVELHSKVGELELSSPILINAMTGGGGEKTYQINRDLAIVAKELGMPMAVGSQMAALKDACQTRTYKVVREVNKSGLLMANLGSEATVDDALAAIDMIDADAIQIHLNTIQELTMPEGDTNFTNALNRIEKIVNHVNVPVIVKEVGFGMSRETVEKLQSIGVNIIDVGGFGGTNFARIENARRERLLTFFEHWGIPTAISIVEAKSCSGQVDVIGSGGIKSSIDIVKALALGASAVGMAGGILKILLQEGVETLLKELTVMMKEIKILMAALGAKTVSDLHHVPVIITGNAHHWLTERGINTKKFSQRSLKD